MYTLEDTGMVKNQVQQVVPERQSWLLKPLQHSYMWPHKHPWHNYSNYNNRVVGEEHVWHPLTKA